MQITNTIKVTDILEEYGSKNKKEQYDRGGAALRHIQETAASPHSITEGSSVWAVGDGIGDATTAAVTEAHAHAGARAAHAADS